VKIITMDKKQDPRQEASPQTTPATNQPPQEQLIPKKGEEYMREAGNIEDMPDPEELDEAHGMKGE
jgi:hypothetical protein